MTDNPDTCDALQNLLLGSSLNSPPSGGKMRLPEVQSKPWEALGISRATWYRKKKPALLNPLESQAAQAKWFDQTLRTWQRYLFAERYGTPELWILARETPDGLAAHQKAEIEKWRPIIKAANIKGE
jgi:hypothetical protein